MAISLKLPVHAALKNLYLEEGYKNRNFIKMRFMFKNNKKNERQINWNIDAARDGRGMEKKNHWMISVLRLKIDFLLVLDYMLFYQIDESEEYKKLIHVSDFCRLRIHHNCRILCMHCSAWFCKNNNNNDDNDF